MNDAERKVVEAARDWAAERNPEDQSEKVLMLALADAFPDDFLGKEHCKCGEKDSCDECPTTAEVKAWIEKLRRDVQPS